MRQIFSPLDGFRSPFGRRSGAAFTPAGLFALAEPGVWYDPSDLTTMFQDTAGTTPVTTPGQTVALALDKSKGLVLGSELVTNGTFDSGIAGWTSGLNSPVLSWVPSGAMRVSRGATAGFSVTTQSISGLVVGKTYLATAEFSAIASGLSPYIAINSVVSGTNRAVFRATATSHTLEVVTSTGSTGQSFDVDNISVKELPGNHATQATLASRPTYGIVPLGGRRNLLTRTEEFGDAGWLKVDTTAANTASTTDPLGGTTADTLTDNAANGRHIIYQTFSDSFNVNRTLSVYAKQNTLRYLVLTVPNASDVSCYSAIFDLQGGTVTGTKTNGTATLTTNITSVGNGWWRCSISGVVATSGSGSFFPMIATSDRPGFTGTLITNNVPSYSGTGQSLFLWGAQLETGSSATNYQRVGSAFDVTEAGVASLSYLSFDGVDDFMVTPTITPGIDKAQVFAGVRKLSDAARGIVVELSSIVTNPGALALYAPSGTAAAAYLFGSGGSSTATTTSPTSYAAPITNVITGLGDISGDTATLRLDGSQVAQATTDQGTGNFLAYPLYIGRRGGTTLPFNGNLFSLIVRFGTNLDAGTITSTETWVNSKTGAYT